MVMLSKTCNLFRPLVSRHLKLYPRILFSTNELPHELEASGKDEDQPRILYKGSQAMQIRVMLGTATFNIMVYRAHLSSCH